MSDQPRDERDVYNQDDEPDDDDLEDTQEHVPDFGDTESEDAVDTEDEAE